MTEEVSPNGRAIHRHLAVFVGVLAFVLDQISKAGAIFLLSTPPGTVPVTSFFSLSLGFNRGVSFGMLSDLGNRGPATLSLLAIAVIIFLIVWYCKTSQPKERVGIAMIIGGACGNLFDRVRNGAVTDFLDFYVGPYHWPAFNFADVWITLGAALVVAAAVFAPKFDEQSHSDRLTRGE